MTTKRGAADLGGGGQPNRRSRLKLNAAAAAAQQEVLPTRRGHSAADKAAGGQADLPPVPAGAPPRRTAVVATQPTQSYADASAGKSAPVDDEDADGLGLSSSDDDVQSDGEDDEDAYEAPAGSPDEDDEDDNMSEGESEEDSDDDDIFEKKEAAKAKKPAPKRAAKPPAAAPKTSRAGRQPARSPLLPAARANVPAASVPAGTGRQSKPQLSPSPVPPIQQEQEQEQEHDVVVMDEQEQEQDVDADVDANVDADGGGRPMDIAGTGLAHKSQSAGWQPAASSALGSFEPQAPVPEEVEASVEMPVRSHADEQRRRLNIAALQDNAVVPVRQAANDLLHLPICLRPFKPPTVTTGPRRSRQADVLLHKKTLGLRRQPVPWGAPKRQVMEDARIAGASGEEEEGEEEDTTAFEPLVLWTPPAGSPEHWKPVSVDPIMCRRLRPHQREGVQFCFDCLAGLKKYSGQGCILADDMGLGKTFMSIAIIWTVLRQGVPCSVEGSGHKNFLAAKDKAAAAGAEPAAAAGDEQAAAAAGGGDAEAPAASTAASAEGQGPMAKKVIVVCPTSLIGNWDNEMNKWLAGKIRTCPLESGPHVEKNIRGFLDSRSSAPTIP